MRRWLVGSVLVWPLVAAEGGLPGTAPVHAAHNTCSLVTQAGGETAVETWALTNLNAKLPKTFSGKVTVGRVPVTNDPIRVDVDATIKKPAKSVDITCASSALSSKLEIRVRVSGRAGSSTHEGDGRITGHYTIAAASPPRVCVSNLKMASLNLQGVQNDVDDWIRKQINHSALVGNFCVP
jgi:hypothetical protein